MADRTLQDSSRPQHTPTSQFSLRSLVLAVAFVSFSLAWVRWFEEGGILNSFYPGFYGICSVAALLMAYCELRTVSGCSSAWNWIAVAWLIVIANVYYGFLFFGTGSYTTPNADVIAQGYQETVYYSIVSAVSVPLLCTLPALYVLIAHYHSLPTRVARWIYLALVIVFLDAILCTVFYSIALGTWAR